jgi:hypothetical protein
LLTDVLLNIAEEDIEIWVQSDLLYLNVWWVQPSPKKQAARKPDKIYLALIGSKYKP